ncbi:MAG: FAD:protein FMN transferase [Planctomycetes bacterium]|nr:FAD:protein FMN transferase [Planctomycetota bacterium]
MAAADGFGGGIATAAGWSPLATRSRQGARLSDEVPRQGWAFGAPVAITVAGVPREQADRALDAAFGELDAAQSCVDWRGVEVSASRIRLRRPVAAVTLNGIAQGFAADLAAEALREHGVAQALIDAGDITGLGNRPDGYAWTAGIQHPRREDAWVSVTELRGRSLATSGDRTPATHRATDAR